MKTGRSEKSFVGAKTHHAVPVDVVCCSLLSDVVAIAAAMAKLLFQPCVWMRGCCVARVVVW